MNAGMEDRGSHDPRSFLLVRFKKKGILRFLSQAEVQKTLIRLLRLARFPLVYSRGYHPRPRISFGRAVKTGVVDLAMYAVLELEEPIDDPASRFNAVAPKGLEISNWWWGKKDYIHRIEKYRYRIVIERSLVDDVERLLDVLESPSVRLGKDHIVVEYSRGVDESDLIFETVESLTGSKYPKGIVLPVRVEAFPKPEECEDG